MKVQLEVLACTAIQGQSAWPKLTWLGQEREKENLFALDHGRVSVLYLPSGKTRHKLPTLAPLVESALTVTSSKNGHYLAGILQSGDVFIWHKHTDHVQTIPGLPRFVAPQMLKPGQVWLWVDEEASRALVAVDFCQFLLWQADRTGFHGDAGTWTKVLVSDRVPTTSADCKEACITAMFFHSQVLGSCCQCSLTFNLGDKLCTTTAHLRFPDARSMSNAAHTEWLSLQIPLAKIAPRGEQVNARGAYVACYTHDGQVLAVAANQRRPDACSILFLHPLTDTLIIASLQGCGVSKPQVQQGRHHWVRDMAWTCDDLFLACMLDNGSACILPRLGEPALLQTTGCSRDMGPAPFLPLHPLIQEPRMAASSWSNQLTSGVDSGGQRFSVSSHPTVPLLLFSDGFVVSLLQLPPHLSLPSALRELVLEANRCLKHVSEVGRLDLSLATTRDLLLTGGSLSGSREGGRSLSGAGLLTMPTSTLLQQRSADSSVQCAALAQRLLLTAWHLAASTSLDWSAPLDKMVRGLLKGVAALWRVLLDGEGGGDGRGRSAGLASVRVSYGRLLDVLQFDVYHQHLAASSLGLAHLTASAILTSPHLNASEPRIQTLTDVYDLLKYTEKVLNRTYVWLPHTLAAKGLGSPLSDQYEPALASAHYAVILPDREQQRQQPAIVGTSSQILTKRPVRSDSNGALRLTGTWKMLYKAVLQYQNRHSTTEQEYSQAQGLLAAIQTALQALSSPIPHQVLLHINQGDQFSLDGQHTLALDAWRKQLQRMQGKDSKMAGLLHSILYTLLLRGDLGGALEFVDSLVIHGDARTALNPKFRPTDSLKQRRPAFMTLVTSAMEKSSELKESVPCIRDRAVRQLVQTLARFMAAYFSNEILYVFPPHNAQPLPAVHLNFALINVRIIPRYHGAVTEQVCGRKLDGVWNVERTLEYLLLSGLVCEAAWFAQRMGDWKAAFLLSVAHSLHHHIAPHLYTRPSKPLRLPDDLSPTGILQHKLGEVLLPPSLPTSSPSTTPRTPIDTPRSARNTPRSPRVMTPRSPHSTPHDPPKEWPVLDNSVDLHGLTTMLRDVLTAGVIGGSEVVPWLLTSLVAQLKSAVKMLTPLVPNNIYLPAPPVYCPQPSSSTQGVRGLQGEQNVRLYASALVRLFLCVLDAAHLSLPVLRSYVTRLADVQERATQFKVTTEGPCLELPELLRRQLSCQSVLEGRGHRQSNSAVLAAFRDLLSLVWLLHARDQLSLVQRQRQAFLNRPDAQAGWSTADSGQWYAQCWGALRWAVQVAAFSRFLGDEASVYKVALSLVAELPATESSADVLAELCHQPQALPPDVQDRLEKLLTEWEQVILTPEDDGRSAKPDESVEEGEGVEGDSGDVRKSVTFFQASPRGQSLSVYFTKQCTAAFKLLRKRAKAYGAYEEFVFATEDEADKDKPVPVVVGSRPFESKASFLEFLDTFADVTMGQQVRDEVKGRVAVPLLSSFAPTVVQQLVSGTERSSRQQLAIRLLSSRPALPESTSAKQAGSAATRGAGLFRGRPRGGGETRTGGPSAPSASQDKGGLWEMAVDFGADYQSLEQRLTWLEEWAGRQHVLAPWTAASTQDSRPSVKLAIPAPLLTLSLWLIHNRYVPAPSKSKQGSANTNQNANPNKKDPPRTPTVPQAQPTATASSPPPRHKSPSPERGGKRRGRGGMEGEEALQSSFIQEQEQVAHAYKQLLDEQDSSSSLELSSLATEDLDMEIHVSANSAALQSKSPASTRPENSALNHVVVLEESPPPQSSGTHSQPQPSASHPRPRPRNRSLPSPSQTSDQAATVSHSLAAPGRKSAALTAESSVGEAWSSVGGAGLAAGAHPQPFPSAPQQGQQWLRGEQAGVMGSQTGASQGPAQVQAGITDRSMGPGSENLAQQLQHVVRSEMRRVLQVQHHSLMAMMGALQPDDADNPPSLPPLPPAPVHHSPPAASPQQLPPGVGVGVGSVSGVLHELRHLQVSVQSSAPRHPRASSPSSSQGPLSLSQLHPPQQAAFPLLHLHTPGPAPALPFMGPGVQQPQHRTPNSAAPLPLLSIEKAPGPRLPPPPPYHEQSPFPPMFAWPPPQAGYPPPPAPPAAPVPRSFSDRIPYFAPAPAPPAPGIQPPQGSFPLLRLNLSAPSPAAAASDLSAQEKQQQLEAVKWRHLSDFHRLAAENASQSSETRFSRLLQFQPPSATSPSPPHGSPPTRQRPTLQKPAQPRPDRKVKTLPAEGVTRPREASMESEAKQAPGQMRQQEEEADDEAEMEEREEEEEEALHEGYAIKPGTFDHMLHVGSEEALAADSNARFQFELTQRMEQQRRKERRKVDFGVMTMRERVDAAIETEPWEEPVRTAEAATSITKDTGTDPVQEALMEHARTAPGATLPPDVFLGLRFPEAEAEGSHQSRSYLNVLDIRASAVLRDIPDKPEGETAAAAAPSLLPPSVPMADMAAVEESMRMRLEPTRPTTYDPVTVRMFRSHPSVADRVSVALLPRGTNRTSREGIVRQLRLMDDQLQAIDAMSHNIKRDFDSSRLALGTLEAVTQSMQAASDASHIGHESPTQQLEPTLSTGTAQAPSPKHSLRSLSASPEPSSSQMPSKDKLAPTLSDHSPVRSASSSTFQELGRPVATSLSQMSGLSGVSEVIGEVLAKGGVDLEAAGLTPSEAQRFLQRARRLREADLEERLAEAGKDEDEAHREEAAAVRRQEVHSWMEEKRAQRLKDYRQQRQELIEREPHPYKPPLDPGPVTAPRDRAARERELEQQARRRLQDAELLLGSLLVDHPQLPPEPQPRSPRRDTSRSPQRDTSRSPRRGTVRSPQRSAQLPKASQASRPGRPKSSLQPSAQLWSERPDRGRQRGPGPGPSRLGATHTVSTELHPPRGILKTGEGVRRSSELMVDWSAETLGGEEDWEAYRHAVEHREQQELQPDLEDRLPARQKAQYSRTEASEREDKEVARIIKYRPFTDIVKLQRPHITRKSPPLPPPPPSTVQPEVTARPLLSGRPPSSPSSRSEPMTPGHALTSGRQSSRRVKTYVERLQEMKPRQQFTTPIRPPSSLPVSSRRSDVMPCQRATRPRHKPQTYTQRLKQISSQAPRVTSRRTGGAAVQNRTYLKARGPSHAPQTYTQQLQSLNPYRGRGRAGGGTQRTSGRPRPYASPYVEPGLTLEDSSSDVSEWAVDDDVKRLLYDDDYSTSIVGGGTSLDLLSNGQSDYFDQVMDHSYAQSVDVDDLERIADSMSVDSFIDWDRVDELIADDAQSLTNRQY